MKKLVLVLLDLVFIGYVYAEEKYKITEVTQSRSYSVVYLRISPSTVALPWQLTGETVNAVSAGGNKYPLAGCVPRGRLIVKAGIIIKKGADNKSLALDIVTNGQDIQLLGGASRAPDSNEVGLAFRTEKGNIASLQIKIEGSKTIKIPVKKSNL